MRRICFLVKQVPHCGPLAPALSAQAEVLAIIDVRGDQAALNPTPISIRKVVKLDQQWIAALGELLAVYHPLPRHPNHEAFLDTQSRFLLLTVVRLALGI